MKPQSSILLSVLCILLLPGPVLPVGSVSTNATVIKTPTNPSTLSTNQTEVVMTTKTFISTDKMNTEITSTHQSESTVRLFTSKTSTTSTTWAQTTTHTAADAKDKQGVATAITVVLILFLLVFIVLCICVYKWYSRNLEQHSFRELRRSIVRSVRTSRAAGILERLRPSRKQKEDEVDMEEGGVEETSEGQEKQGHDEDDDTSDDYSSMDGAVMVTKAKQEQEPEDESTTSDEQEEEEALEEKTEGAKDDLTKL